MTHNHNIHDDHSPDTIDYKYMDDGIKETVWKAGLDLELPTNLEEIQEEINEVSKASKF